MGTNKKFCAPARKSQRGVQGLLSRQRIGKTVAKSTQGCRPTVRKRMTGPESQITLMEGRGLCLTSNAHLPIRHVFFVGSAQRPKALSMVEEFPISFLTFCGRKTPQRRKVRSTPRVDRTLVVCARGGDLKRTPRARSLISFCVFPPSGHGKERRKEIERNRRFKSESRIPFSDVTSADIYP